MAAASFAAFADPVDELVKATMQRQHVPAMTVGIIRDGKLVSSRAYGLSDLELNVKADKQDLFEIGSITKQFTAFAVWELFEQGKISLEDQVGKYIPESPKAWDSLKIRNLLYQTSGLADYALEPGLGLVENFDRAKFLSIMGAKPLDFEPGVSWAYSNTNYALLGWVIEKAAGMPYTKFVTETIFKPLGMSHTLFENPDAIIPHRAHGYIVDGGQLMRASSSSASINSDGTIMSNLEDMAKWDDALGRHKILKESSYAQMWSPAVLNNGRKRMYGTGWFLTQYKGVPYVGHGGNSSGYSAGFARYPSQHLSVVILANVYPISGEALAKSIAETIQPALRTPIPTAATDVNPRRTERLKQALAKLAALDPDPEFLEPDLFAPLKTARMKTFNPYLPLKKIDRLDFASSEAYDQDTLLTYRLAASGRSFTVLAIWSKENKLATLLMRPDPPKA
jgi:CubicO group peptidase (beta-lactamase class C family)